ncbi:MAG TPA: TadE/TadG family type IV pilus assembly protein [Devosia sp.]
MSLRGLTSRLRIDQSGAALVEMAIVAPLMLTLAAGVFEFSNALHTKLMLEAGIADGARYVARCVRVAADKVSCGAAAANIAVTATADGTGAVRVGTCTPTWAPASVTVSYPTSVPAINPGTLLRDYLSQSTTVEVVEVTTSCQYVGTGLLTFIGFSPLTLTATHQERVLGW